MSNQSNKAKTLQRRGMRARERAMERAGSSRVSSAAWYPEVEWLTDLGYTNAEIAQALNISERRISQIRQEGREDGSGLVVVRDEPKDLGGLEGKYADMLPFTAEAFKLFYEEFSGYELLDHMYDWVKLFVEHRTLMLNVPPRHGKSIIFAVWIPIWLFCRNREEEVLLVSKTMDLARDWVAEIAYQLEFNNDIVRVFGRFAPERSGETAWRPSRGELMLYGRKADSRTGQLSLRARGSEQHILGREASVVIVDDVTDGSIARSPAKREEQARWLREEVFSRVMPERQDSPSGRAVVIGQRVHLKDIYGMLQGQTYERGPKRGEPLWTVVKTPAVLRWPGEDRDHPDPIVLWPELWPFEELMHRYELLGHASFQCLFQQEPLPEDARLVTDEWLERCRDKSLPGFRGDDRRGTTTPVARVVSLDPSPTKYNGLVVLDVPYDRHTFTATVVEAKHWRGGLRTIVDEVKRCVQTYRPDYFIFEQSTFSTWLREDPLFEEIARHVKVIGHNTGRNKGDPQLGLESLGGDVEMGRLRLPYGDEAGRQMSKLLEGEMVIWPFGDHDDILMALWFVKWNYKRLVPKGALPTTFRGGEGVRVHSYIKRFEEAERRAELNKARRLH